MTLSQRRLGPGADLLSESHLDEIVEYAEMSSPLCLVLGLLSWCDCLDEQLLGIRPEQTPVGLLAEQQLCDPEPDQPAMLVLLGLLSLRDAVAAAAHSIASAPAPPSDNELRPIPETVRESGRTLDADLLR